MLWSKSNIIFMKYVFTILSVIFFNSCSAPIALSPTDKYERTCLVLSVGAEKGLAQIGGIDAISELGLNIDCVYGNSAGSIIGGLFAYNPDSNLRSEIYKLFNNYIKIIKKEKSESMMSAGLFSYFLGFGFLESLIIGGLNSESISSVNIETFEKVLNSHFKNLKIENTKIDYATSFININSNEPITIKKHGNLANAITKSCNNPFIFGKLHPTFDAGVDRIASTPIEDAYNLFKPDRIIALNVTGRNAFYSQSVKCKVDEIVIDINQIQAIYKNKEDELIRELIKNKKSLKNFINSFYSVGYKSVKNFYLD